jgi:hypothetical protein
MMRTITKGIAALAVAGVLSCAGAARAEYP